MLKFSQRLLLTSYLPVVLYFDCYIIQLSLTLMVSQAFLMLLINNIFLKQNYKAKLFLFYGYP